jgi:hypothetical protein
LLTERKPRIRLLGTGLIERDVSRAYQYRNEITCAQEPDAQEIHRELQEQTAYTIGRFIFKLLDHRIRLPGSKQVSKPGADPKPPDENRPDGTASSIHVTPQGTKVDFTMDLIFTKETKDQKGTKEQVEGIATLAASMLRAEMDAAAVLSIRHQLAAAGKTLGEKGLKGGKLIDPVPATQFPPGAFPAASTLLTADREPKNRISWMVGLLPYMGQKNIFDKIDFERSWHDPKNWMPGRSIVPQFIDPSYPDITRQVAIGELPIEFGTTHYVGIAGVGRDAAWYRRGDKTTEQKQGVFAYDGSASLAEVRSGRGLSSTILMAQIPHDGPTGVGPWIAGGGATLWGVPEKNSIAPFVLSTDRNGKPILHQNKQGTFVLTADGSVRFIEKSVSDDVFQAMCTLLKPLPGKLNLDTNPTTPLVPEPKKEVKKEPQKADPAKKPAKAKEEKKPAPPAPKGENPKGKPAEKTSHWSPSDCFHPRARLCQARIEPETAGRTSTLRA